MSFKINGLPASMYRDCFSKSDRELAEHGMKKYVADSDSGFPCRVSLLDAKKGETLILVHHEHHAVDSPYRASGPIFVRESAHEDYSAVDEIPEQLLSRMLSLRGYDANGFMRTADVVDGQQCKSRLDQFLENPDIEYVHVHNARQGCFMCQVDRIPKDD